MFILFNYACFFSIFVTFGPGHTASYNYLKEYGGIEFLIKHYEIENTLGIDEAIDDIKAICIKHGGIVQ